MNKVTQLTSLLCLTAVASAAQAVTLVEFDFAGSGGASSYGIADGQFTTINANVIFDDTVDSLTAINSWNYDGTGTAAANGDLINNSVFGSTSRFDIDLGFAASGFSYTITSVEVDIRANNEDGSTFQFGYRDYNATPGAGATNVIGSELIATQSGANPIATYSIDVSGEGLTATSSAVSWDTSAQGELRFLFYDATTDDGLSDNFQVAAIRIVGTTNAIPEPSSYALMTGMLGLGCILLRRRR